MRIDPLDFGPNAFRLSADKGTNAPETDFVDTLRQAVSQTNETLKKAEKASVDLASGETGNIHEVMIQQQKADISLRLLVTSTNKLINAYNELKNLR
ncbi:MAG: flagellar hook-basal body complex protein FliE [Thermodesulfobacteriota bacterium]|nr:flagellar hook-basal body complex protein FliE [Thermodesulfobacteriota bacterium]